MRVIDGPCSLGVRWLVRKRLRQIAAQVKGNRIWLAHGHNLDSAKPVASRFFKQQIMQKLQARRAVQRPSWLCLIPMFFAPLNPGVVVIPIEAARNVAPTVNEHMEMRPSPLREFAHRDRMPKFRLENPTPKIRHFSLSVTGGNVLCERDRHHATGQAMNRLERSQVLAGGFGPFSIIGTELARAFYTGAVRVCT
jgi:hypothetical protein